MPKIAMTTPLVEMDGDEMTRILWRMIKEHLVEPFVALQTEYYDLGLPNREATADQVTVDAALATRRLGVAVKCATITANAQRVEEYGLTRQWKSPNATIRALLDGTVFRAPIPVAGITPAVRSWKKPITIARHAYGDIYRNTEMRVPGPGRAELVFTGVDGEQRREVIHDFEGPGVLQGVHNLDASIESFAHACFTYGLAVGQDVWFAAKDTISKTYDQHFKEVFQRVFDAQYAPRFMEKGVSYFYTLIDDAVARVIRSDGGMVWACKNYDGDVMSDMVATAFGSLAMMTSVLVSPQGQFEYEAAHGTVTRHYYRHLRGERTSTNPVATIFAWSGALRKRGELDALPGLAAFAGRLERATLGTIAEGRMTQDLVDLFEGPAQALTSEDFLRAVAEKLR
ncbi:MAG: NADP-dependent isocitrate dehydrogenase [Oscillospiraceae bacterium]|jgi:isocitrate dehydrogenase|nr:NADP-dependent isocitrate dehydrogenase [Oscillospiraceae bacterium]